MESIEGEKQLEIRAGSEQLVRYLRLVDSDMTLYCRTNQCNVLLCR